VQENKGSEIHTFSADAKGSEVKEKTEVSSGEEAWSEEEFVSA
jgi:hypothetical protein